MEMPAEYWSGIKYNFVSKQFVVLVILFIFKLVNYDSSTLFTCISKRCDIQFQKIFKQKTEKNISEVDKFK